MPSTGSGVLSKISSISGPRGRGGELYRFSTFEIISSVKNFYRLVVLFLPNAFGLSGLTSGLSSRAFSTSFFSLNKASMFLTMQRLSINNVVDLTLQSLWGYFIRVSARCSFTSASLMKCSTFSLFLVV